MKTVSEEIQIEIDKLSEKAIQEVIILARVVLKNCPALHEFMNGMGSYFFTAKSKKQAEDFGFSVDSDKHPTIHDSMGENEELLESIEGYVELREFIMEWDNIFHLTGEPMRFTATSKIIENW